MAMTAQESLPTTPSPDSQLASLPEPGHQGSTTGSSVFDRWTKRLSTIIQVFWSAPHRWENLATRFGVGAVLTMSAIQTAYFFGLASPDPIEKAKAIVFSGWMDFCLFMAFIRAQRAISQEDYGRAVAWSLGCLPLAAFTFLCNFMFSSHWQPPDPLALERVGLSPFVALLIYACVPLVAVVYGTLFTVKEITREEKQRRQQARDEAQWQAEIADPRGRLRKMRLMRRVLAGQIGIDLDDADAEEQALFAAYEVLLAERGISLVDREAPIHFEDLLHEMRKFSIQLHAPNAVALFRMRSAGLPALESSARPTAETSKQISSPDDKRPHLFATGGPEADGRTLPTMPPPPARSPLAPQAQAAPRSATTSSDLLQSMLEGDSGGWATHLTVEQFIATTNYNPDYVKRLVRRGNIRSEEVQGERRIPLAEVARFALERASEEMAAQILARIPAASDRVVDAVQRPQPSGQPANGEDSEALE